MRRALISVSVLLSVCTFVQHDQLWAFRNDSLSDRELYVQVAQNTAFNEFRCNGKSAEETKEIMNSRFKLRIEAVEAAMKAKYGLNSVEVDDMVAIGQNCSRYSGAIRRLERNLKAIEQRLGIK